jgi:hypothetical protein
MDTQGEVLLGPVFVNHHPYTYGDAKYDSPWKEAVAAKCDEAWQGRAMLREQVHLRIRFYLKNDYDLTGLLESTVNGIANAIFPMSAGGGPKTKWNHDDRWVHSIEASKELTNDKHGAEIVVMRPARVSTRSP